MSQLLLYYVVYSNIPVARQIIGFLYLTFVPGIIFIRLLKMELDLEGTVILSVGFSVAFLMLAGLLTNEVCFIFGILRPLSLTPLVIVISSVVLIGALLAFSRTENVELSRALDLNPMILFLAGLPLLSIAGVIYANTDGSNLILLFMMIFISLTFVILLASHKSVSSEIYFIAVFTIALSLLYHSTLISNYLTTFGSDVGLETLVSKYTQANAYWISGNTLGDMQNGRVYSMLSVTILPTIYSSVLNMDPAWVFKIIYPLFLSLVPLGMYELWKEGFGGRYAFISAFLFVSNSIFYNEMLGLNKQIIAELFFILLLFTIFNRRLKPNHKVTCFIIFSIALVTSHYGIAEIFLFFISSALILSIVTKRPSRNITPPMVVFFIIVMFSWYVFISEAAAFNTFIQYGGYVYYSLKDIFNLESRETAILRGLGLEAPPTIWNAIGRGFVYSVQLLILAGLIGLVAKKAEHHLDRDLFIFDVVAVMFLALLILLPGLSKTMNMTRFFQILLFFLAPLAPIGADLSTGLLIKQRNRSWSLTLLLIILVPYFLFQTGFVYEITGNDSWSISLSRSRMSPYRLLRELGYIDEQDAFSADWISNENIRNTQIYCSNAGKGPLTCYGMINPHTVMLLTNTTKVMENGTVYVDRLSMIEGALPGTSDYLNLTSSSFREETNKIYSDGGSEIYRNG